jgi:hypothetical protein
MICRADRDPENLLEPIRIRIFYLKNQTWRSDSGKWLDKRINRILLNIGTVQIKYTNIYRNISRIFVSKFISMRAYS